MKTERESMVNENWDIFLILMSAVLLSILKEVIFMYFFIIFLMVSLIRTIFNKQLRKNVFRWILLVMGIVFLIVIFYLYILFAIVAKIGGAG